MTTGLEILRQLKAIPLPLPTIIQEKQEGVLALLQILEVNLERVSQAKTIAEDLLGTLESIARKSEEIRQTRDSCSPRNMDNCDQGTALFEQTVRDLAVHFNTLDRLLAWSPERSCECGKKIEPERLEIVPDATLCAECARKSS